MAKQPVRPGLPSSYLGLSGIQLTALLAAALSQGADGAITMMISLLSSWIQCEFAVNALNTASMNAVLFLGQLVGKLVLGLMCDFFGRKHSILLFLCMASLLNVLFALSPTFAWIALLRFILGFFLGDVAVTYVIDFLPVERRRLAGAAFSFWSIGNLLGMALAMMASHGWSWRTVTVLASLFPILTAIVLSLAPESPRYLYVSGQVEKAKRVLSQMASPECEPKLQLDKFSRSLIMQTKKTTIKDAIFNPHYQSATVLQCVLKFAAGLTYFGVASLSVTYFRQDKGSSLTSLSTSCSACTPLSRGYYIAQLYFAVGDLLGCVLFYVLVDRIGRRTTLFVISSSGILFMLCLFGENGTVLAKLAVFMLKVVVHAFHATVSQLAAEIYPTSVRGSLVAFGYMFYCIGAMLSPFVAEVLIKEVSWLPIIVLSSVYALSCFALVLVPVETRGRELEDF